MEFQTLKKDNRKYWVIGILVILAIVATIAFVGTRAKYRNTQSIQIAKGTIDYSSADFTIVSMTDQNGNELTAMPSSGYTIDEEKSYCTINGVKDTNVILKTIDGNHTFANLQKGSKCYLYFKEVCGSACKTILADNGGASAIETKTSPDFSKTSCSSGCGEATNGMYAAEDDDGISYYFRGTVDNNWVSFGGFYWRIIRINGDGTIRLIYNGTSAGATGASAQLSSTSKYNTGYTDNMYVGYMYTNGEVHGTGTDSTIKGVVDNWYNSNLNKTGVKEYIDTNAGFCNDRTPSSGTGTGTTYTQYAPYDRLYTNKSPSLKCTSSSDLFTVSGANKGNEALTYPVGLITADEVASAGGVVEENYNRRYWLYTGSSYWTMSPLECFSEVVDGALLFYVYSEGSLEAVEVDTAFPKGVRPVINLKADTVFSSGNGTSSSPYVVKTS